jgi:hypothetical protein
MPRHALMRSFIDTSWLSKIDCDLCVIVVQPVWAGADSRPQRAPTQGGSEARGGPEAPWSIRRAGLAMSKAVGRVRTAMQALRDGALSAGALARTTA